MNQIQRICKAAGCSAENLPGLTTLHAWCNSGITAAGRQAFAKRRDAKKNQIAEGGEH